MSTARIPLIASGAALALTGVGVSVAGAAGMAFVGRDDTLRTSAHRVTTSATALVLPIDEVDTRGADVLGRPTVRASMQDAAAPVFLGIGPAAEVDAYLAGAAVETVSDVDLDPYELSTEFRSGTARPGPPAAQSFWVARGDGARTAQLSWKLRSGDYRLVVMNVDAAPGVAASGRVGVTVAHLWAVGVTVLVLGLLAAALGAALLVGGLRVPGRDDTRERAMSPSGG